MDAPRPTLTLHDQSWEYVKDRTLERGQVFRSPDGQYFLRTGDRTNLVAEMAFAHDLYARGFPVPEITEDGTLNDLGYYVERAIGDRTLGERSTLEYRSHGRVSEETFGAICDVTLRFWRAQIKPQNVMDGPSELRIGINIENVIEENPDLDALRLEQALSTVEAHVRDLPLVLSHGDFGPFNLLEEGVIDFEHKFIAPAGFDVLTGVFVGRFWNYTDGRGRLRLAYDFTDEQIRHYMRLLDEVGTQHGIANMSQYTDDFLLLKAIWSLSFEKAIAQQAGDEIKWHWRKAVLKYCMDQYMAHQPIDTTAFGHLPTA